MKKKKNVFLLFESSTGYGRKVAQGISQFVRERENWTIHVEDRDLFSIPPQLLHGWKGDGIISRTPAGAIKKLLQRCQCPHVELLGVDTNMPAEVLPNDYRVMQLCVDHFLDRGVTSLAFYGFGWNWWIELRYRYFTEITTNRKVNVHSFVDKIKRKGEPLPKWDECYEKPLQHWLKKLPNRTGVIAAYDPQALRIINACRQIGINIPEQIAIIGIDNDEHVCNLATPPLSSLDVNAEIVGYKAAELLDLKMNRKKLPAIPILVTPKGVVVRRSSDITAIDDSDLVEALRYIGDSIMLGIGTDEVAGHVGLSRSTLCRLFQNKLNRSPKGEIMRVRLNHAKHLLANTNLSVKKIASQIGYKTIEHFTAVFKREMETTPVCYRNENQKFIIDDNIDIQR